MAQAEEGPGTMAEDAPPPEPGAAEGAVVKDEVATASGAVDREVKAPAAKKAKRDGAGAGGAEQRKETEKFPSLEDYLEDRVFVFLHHYSGPRDPLCIAVRSAAARHGLEVMVVSVDYEKDGADLLKAEPYETHLGEARRGRIDGFHTGWPCTTYSRLRWRPKEGYPGPVRSRREPYGRKDNTEAQQAEADQGTLHASRAAHMVQAILEGRRGRLVKPAVTMENPPPSDHPDHISAWEMDEVGRVVVGEDLDIVDFDTCPYQKYIKDGSRHKKPQRFAGTLQDLLGLAASCQCKHGHDPVIGKKKSRASAEYPGALCYKYAELLMSHFKKMGKAEYLELRARDLREEVEGLRSRSDQEKAEKLASSKSAPKPAWWRLDNRQIGGGPSSSAEQGQSELSWTPGQGNYARPGPRTPPRRPSWEACGTQRRR